MIDLSFAIEPVYIATIFFFIIGMQRMSHPLTARSGIVWAGAAMLIATLVTFFTPHLTNFALIAIAIVIGGGFGYIAAKRVAMTDMPQMIALYNGMGGGAAAAISAIALLGHNHGHHWFARGRRRSYRGGIVHGEHRCLPETPGIDEAASDHLPGPEHRQYDWSFSSLSYPAYWSLCSQPGSRSPLPCTSRCSSSSRSVSGFL